MTPLAHRIVADSALPRKDRSYDEAAGILRLLDGVHFFDVSSVCELAFSMKEKVVEALRNKDDRMAFLPAPRTWLEWREPDRTQRADRIAFFLEQRDDRADVGMICLDRDTKLSVTSRVAVLPLRGSLDIGSYEFDPAGWKLDPMGNRPKQIADHLSMLCYSMLAMINTPRVIGRRQHAPHAGLERKLARQRGMVGKFPLQGWTEIVLEVTPPRDASGDNPQDAHYTGRKAQHFCRSHLRIRNGNLERVTAHWRGDPALGIKQSRYTVVPEGRTR